MHDISHDDHVPDDRALILPSLTVEIFSQKSQTASALKVAAKDRHLFRVRWKFFDGGVAEAIQYYKTSPSPALLILESDAETGVLYTQLESLAAECQPETKVMLISSSNDIELYRGLLSRGVTDLVLSPINSKSFISAMQRAYEGEVEVKLGRITAFIGARGGVGSSTVAHNVAAAASRWLDSNVLLADLDLQFGTVGLDFDVDGTYGMNEVLQNADRLDDTLLERMALKFDDHLQILAVETSLDRTPDIHGGAIERLLDVARSTERHVMLDLPRNWTRRMRRTLAAADEVVITATPDLSSLRNVKQMVEYLRHARPNDPSPLLVLNQTGQPRRPEMTPEEFAEVARLDPGPVVPFNARLFGRSQTEGKLVVDFASRSGIAKSFLEIARYIDSYKRLRPKPSFAKRTLRTLKRWW